MKRSEAHGYRHHWLDRANFVFHDLPGLDGLGTWRVLDRHGGDFPVLGRRPPSRSSDGRGDLLDFGGLARPSAG